MLPTLIEIGGVRLATYGVLVAAGYLVSILWLHERRREMGFSEEAFWNCIYALFAGAILGGKLLYWAVEWRHIVSGELRLIRDFRYGFVFFGGFIGCVLAGIIFRRLVPGPFWKPADFFGVALPMGHAIGRVGCLMAGCCSGKPTSMPWAIRFTRPDCLVPTEFLGLPLHPVQLYESAANAAIAFGVWRVLARVRAGRLRHGSAFLSYVAAYSCARFLIEFYRGDAVRGIAWGLSTSQWVALACLGAAVLAWTRLGREKPA